MPESDAPRVPPPEPHYRLPEDAAIARAARRLVRGSRATFASQASFRAAVVAVLQRDDPLSTVSERRLRRVLVGVPGIRLSVRYAERPGRPVPSACPVCTGGLVPIRNRTLSGATVELGRRCVRCEYWTHRIARVPVRYAVTQSSRRPRRAVDP